MKKVTDYIQPVIVTEKTSEKSSVSVTTVSKILSVIIVLFYTPYMYSVTIKCQIKQGLMIFFM